MTNLFHRTINGKFNKIIFLKIMVVEISNDFEIRKKLNDQFVSEYCA